MFPMDFSLKTKVKKTPPKDFETLIERLNNIVGKKLDELSKQACVNLPNDPVHAKGFVGELVELLLGASAESLPIPDFPELGLELKTLPLDENFKPLESTFICYAPLTDVRNVRFEETALYKKITRMLFVFTIAPRDLPMNERTIAGYSFWNPNAEQLATIKNDYNELMELVSLGRINEINAKLGTIIQMRPKAANGKVLTDCIGPDGTIIKTRPRGFYMRRIFTTELIKVFLNQNISNTVR